MIRIETNPSRESWETLCRRPATDNPVVRERVEAILARVKEKGDAALRELSLEIEGRALEALEVTDEEIRKIKRQAKKIIPERVAYWAEKIGVTYGRIAIRLQSSRWGSCAQNGNLNFNCLLVLMPQEILDSVVVHELCHRKHMNHSKEFYNEIYRVFPDYDRCNKWLKENGGVYMKRVSLVDTAV